MMNPRWICTLILAGYFVVCLAKDATLSKPRHLLQEDTPASGAAAADPASAAPLPSLGPSTTTTPYLVPVACDVTTTAVLSVGDSINGYRLVGIPDGMGAFIPGDDDRGTLLASLLRRGQAPMFTLLVNHEIGPTSGVARAHGGTGAFVSKWVINGNTLEVKSGEDLIKTVYVWDVATKSYVATNAQSDTPVQFARFCSGDLPPISAFLFGAYGTRERIFMNGEESSGGRAFAHVVTGRFAGSSWQLPKLGRDAFENQLACPYCGRNTVVIGTDDSNDGQVYVYIGTKQLNSGNRLNPVEAAGLTNGKLYAIRVEGMPKEPTTSMSERASYRFSLVDVTRAAANDDFTEFNATVHDPALKITQWARPEDGSWNPDLTGEFYFATTASMAGVTKLWRLRFSDVVKTPAAGGIAIVITVASGGLDGSATAADQNKPVMLDNLVVNKGNILLQEDPGNQPIVARMWQYNIRKNTLRMIAQHDPNRFTTGAANFMTQDEESSGVISLDKVMARKNCYMANVQNHKASTDPELVQEGQLLVLCTDNRCAG